MTSQFTDAVRELVAIGASIAANCERCFKFHYNEARKLGVSKEDVRRAVETAQMVTDSPAQAIAVLTEKCLRDSARKTPPHCGGPSSKDTASSRS